jgi:hypothetical protein
MAGLSLNFIEAELSSDKAHVFVLRNSGKTAKEWRDEHGRDYHFYFANNQIHYWPKNVQISNELGGVQTEITKQDHANIFSKLLETAISDLFLGLESADKSKVYKGYKLKHHHIWEFTSTKNEVEGELDGLIINRKMSFHPYYLKPKDKTILGFTLAPSLKLKFSWTPEEFIKKGIDLTPLTRYEDGGIVANLQGIYHYLNATGQKDFYEKKIAGLENKETLFQLTERIVKWLNSKKGDLFIPGNSINNFVLRYLPYYNIHSNEIFSPKRYFYNNSTNTKKISYYNQQVKEYKPFSFGSFEDKEVKIGVLFPAEYEGRTESFLKTLERSLKEDLHIKNLKYVPLKIDDSRLESYKKGMYSNNVVIRALDLVLVILNQDHEKLAPNDSPYYVCKAKLIGEGIPTQDIQIETIQNKVHPLVLSNISLNIYAKLGGTAWTIEKEEKLKDELVIGVGSTRSANGTNILGIAQIFHPDGRYIVGSCSPLSTFENYSKNLEEYLFNTLKEIIDVHINTSKSFRLIFHLYKSASEEYELAAIENLIHRFNSYTFDYALLHLGYGHNYRLYNDNGRGTVKKGTFIQLSPYMGLLHFVPDSILPLKIEIDKRSQGFNDLFYLTKQVYWFSNLSHRSYNPSKRTVTIMYPSLMAEITDKLGLVEGWNHDMLEYVKDKQWFI